jgi:hypothetical protein
MAEPGLVGQGVGDKAGAVEVPDVVGGQGVAVEVPRARTLVGDRLQPQPGRPVGSLGQAQTPRLHERAGQPGEEPGPVGAYLALWRVPGRRVVLWPERRADLEDDRPWHSAVVDACLTIEAVQPLSSEAASEWAGTPGAIEVSMSTECAADERREGGGIDHWDRISGVHHGHVSVLLFRVAPQVEVTASRLHLSKPGQSAAPTPMMAGVAQKVKPQTKARRLSRQWCHSLFQ